MSDIWSFFWASHQIIVLPVKWNSILSKYRYEYSWSKVQDTPNKCSYLLSSKLLWFNMGEMQWKTAAWSTKMYQLCCKSGKQWEIFQTRPRHPTITRLEID